MNYVVFSFTVYTNNKTKQYSRYAQKYMMKNRLTCRSIESKVAAEIAQFLLECEYAIHSEAMPEASITRVLHISRTVKEIFIIYFFYS